MKKTLIIVALMGFTAIGSYAQNTKHCACKKIQPKVVAHKKACPPGYVAVHKAHIKRPVAVNYVRESSYTGNYNRNAAQAPDNRESRGVSLRPPVPNGPTDNPDYYLNIPADGNCRWHCSLPY